MLGKLRGIIDEVSSDHILLDVNGVGYLIFVSTRTIQNLSQDGSVVSLLINMQVREDSLSLYGFMHQNEKEWFVKLISVKGIGPKLALTILSSLDPAQIVSAILAKDQASFSKISGVGKKIAERIVIELKGHSTSSEEAKILNRADFHGNVDTSTILDDAVSALSNLGYNRTDAYSVSSKVVQSNQHASLGEVIKLSLRELVK